MNLKAIVAVVCFSVSAIAADKPANKPVEKAAPAKSARSTASAERRANVPITGVVELCRELEAVNSLPARVYRYCKAVRTDDRMGKKFKETVRETIVANASKSETPIPMGKLRWETLSCHESYEKDGFYCTVESSETTKWSAGGDEETGVGSKEIFEPNGVRVEVDKKGRLKPGQYSIEYDCLGCAA